MSAADTPRCPADDALEAFVAAGDAGGDIGLHLAACAPCRDRARSIRENLDFMRGLRADLGPSAAALPRTPLPPDILPGYRLLREIARGGQGVVFEAVQIETKRRVAVKMIEPGAGAAKDGRARRRIELEVEIAAGLRHPNIVTIYDSASLPDGRYAFAMEFIEGVPIDDWARAIDSAAPRDRPALREALRVKLRAFACVCDAVQHAHQNGVIHRDLKPGNILINEAGVPRVVDFGIARRIITDRAITHAGAFAGTLAYASPEQVSGHADAVDTRSDVYSLGLILYEILAARRPYDTDGSLTGAVANITRADPDPIRTVEPGAQPIGDELEAIIRKALAKDRAERYQTAGGLKSDLDNWLEGRTVEARRHSTFYILRKTAARHRAGFAVASGFIILLGGFAVVMTWDAGRLGRQRALLASSLSASNIERGRLHASNDADARAEDLIWPELIADGADPADPRLGFESSIPATQAAWALFELYSQHPSLMHMPLLAKGQSLRFERGTDALRITGPGGIQELRSVPDGRLLASRPARFDTQGCRALCDRTGRYAVSCCKGVYEVLDFQTGERRGFSGPDMPVFLFADLNADNSRVITTSTEGTLTLWSVDPPRRIAQLTDGLFNESRARFSDDGQFILAGVGQAVRAWNADDGSSPPVNTWSVPSEFWTPSVRPLINVAQLTPDHRRIAAAFSTNILVFDAANSSALPLKIEGHRGFVNFIGFSDDSSVLISTGNERGYRAWNPVTGKLLAAFEQSVIGSSAPAVAPDGSLLAVCDVQNHLRVWQTRPQAWLTLLHRAENTVHCVRFSPDGSLIAAAGADGAVRVWRAADHSLVWETPSGVLPRPAVCFSPDGARIAAARRDGVISIWNAAAGGEPVLHFQGPKSPTWISYSPDGDALFLNSAVEPLMHRFSSADGKELDPLAAHTARIVEAAFSPDGSTLATAGGDKMCILWDLRTGAPRLRLEGHTASVRAVAISPDGSQVATGSDDWTIRLWDTRTGECTRIIRDVKQHVFGLAFHPKGNLLFSCCRDPVIQVWDVRTGRELAALEGHARPVLSLCISPDGRTLATGGEDRAVGVWDLTYYQTHVRCNAAAWRASVPQEPR